MINGIPESSTILLVEDNPDDEELTLLAFRNNHIYNTIAVVRDGAEALEYLFRTGKYSERTLSTNPRLVLLDLKLPKVAGFDVLKRLKANPSTQYLPVVVLTTSNQDEDIINSYKFGANSFIRKPVEFLKFNDAIKQLGLYWLLLNEVPLAQ
ncbi:MAG: response regulator receiver [Spirochaetes bacterium]|nr:MAG: response regulator receiver [Spirochaetota bacterium]